MDLFPLNASMKKDPTLFDKNSVLSIPWLESMPIRAAARPDYLRDAETT